MIQERDVLDKIAAVLRSEMSIVDFARWIMANSWNMHQDSSADAIELVQSIHLLLAERDDSSISDNSFVSELASLIGVSVPDCFCGADIMFNPFEVLPGVKHVCMDCMTAEQLRQRDIEKSKHESS